MYYFEKVAQEAKIPMDRLSEICRMMRSEFPNDEMMYELHVLRACLAVKEGYATMTEILQDALPVEK